MYIVTVYRNGEAIDTRNFTIGTWKEIGYWLDHYGYIDNTYELKIQFS
jgi:hypothetical protein